MNVETQSQVKIYELGGKDAPVGAEPLSVESHWNTRKLVVLKRGGLSITVAADDLQLAIDRCCR
jgi:hypothetical protein